MVLVQAMRDLSIIIPALNEQFLSRTIEDILSNIEGDTEVIALCDGYWPNPGVKDNPRVTLIHHTEPMGQRQSTNEGVRLSTAKFVMKCDAHCAFDRGFDIKLMSNCEKDWTVVPSMKRLHVYDMICQECGNRMYQDKGGICDKCGSENTKQEMVWQNRRGKAVDYMWFDTEFKFSYFDNNYLRPYGPDAKVKYHHKHRDWAKDKITDQMVCIGACWMMHRERYWEIGGMDENHGSWGQMGVELACKSWLSGGRQVVNRNTWFAHLFRTTKKLGFPYHLSGKAIQKARKYSQNIWTNNLWDKAVHPLSLMIKKFAPLPGWDEILHLMK